jgi:tRNA(Ile2)-agmatinylcytidine synthase
MGKNKGFRCEKCGSRYVDLQKIETELKRDLEKGLYMTATRSQRHLTRPFRRYGLEKHRGTVEELIGEWHHP